MADIAKRVGVSKSSVSLVLNHRGGVSDETRAAIWKAAQELGYELSRSYPARSLPANKHIAVVHFAGPESGLSVLPTRYVAGIQSFCSNRSINWTLVADYREDHCSVSFRFLEENLPYDGFILLQMYSRDCGLLRRALAHKTPVVVVSRDWPDLPVSSVGQDHGLQARLALDHLLQLGHHKIAFLASESSRQYDWYPVRLGCYRQALESIGEYDPELVVVSQHIGQAAWNLIRNRSEVTAIFAVNDAIAIPAVQRLCEEGVQIPRQVSIIGLDDSIQSPEGCPPLTTVGFPHEKVGHLAAKVLLDEIYDPELAYTRVFVHPYLVEGGSCARPYG